MGQRHQIYVRLPANRDRKEKVFGIHHQWLYGQTACRMLRNFLRFAKQAEDYGPLGALSIYGDVSAQRLLESLYSVDYQTGYYHNVHSLDAECDDPRLGDNNDGITIIDLTDDEPRYCFMSIGHLEGHGKQPKVFTPLSAAEYFAHYYPPEQLAEMSAEFLTESESILVELESAELLTLAEVEAVFPKMMPSPA